MPRQFFLVTAIFFLPQELIFVAQEFFSFSKKKISCSKAKCPDMLLKNSSQTKISCLNYHKLVSK